MLGPGSGSLRPSALSDLAHAVLAASADLAVPRYDLPPHAGLINSAILYPLTRALFSSRVRFPLAVDLGLSMRMLERLAAAGQRFTALNQDSALLWPIDEAAVAGFAVTEIEVGPRTTPQPAETDINAILASVTGSLFSDIDAKAAFWQRARYLPPTKNSALAAHPATSTADIAPMLDAFCRPTRCSVSSGCRLPMQPRSACRRACGRASCMTFCLPTGCAPSIAATCWAR
jgi:hypothetical protein